MTGDLRGAAFLLCVVVGIRLAMTEIAGLAPRKYWRIASRILRKMPNLIPERLYPFSLGW
jgi:hypothetical protein